MSPRPKFGEASQPKLSPPIYFSDNITTMELKGEVEVFSQAENPPGCLLLAREEANPQAFGVAVFDDSNNIIDIVEKPTNPPSNMAIGGIYLYDENFWNILDQEFENNQDAFSISDVNRHYVKPETCKKSKVMEKKLG